MPTDTGTPDMSEYARMGVTIQAGKPFEEAVKKGVPDTPQMREAFDKLKKGMADIEKRGHMPDFDFD